MGELQQLIAALQMMQANGGVAVGQKVIGAPTNQGFYSRGMFGYNTETDVLSTMIMDSTLSQWFGFTGSIRELKTTKLLDWVGPTGTDDQSVDWARENDCGDCPSVEWGKCELLACFGEICAQSPTMKLTDMGTEKWEGQPMYYVAGPNFNKVIQTDEEWFLSLAAQVWNQMLQRMLIVGNKTNTPKDFDGLQVLVNTPVTDYRTGARCHSAEPVIYNWASAAISNTICALINSIVRRIRRRALPLGGVRSSAGDLIMVMTSTMRDALLDWVACGCTPCAGGLPWIVANTFDTRSERDRLNGGLYGDGQIPVDGEMVPIVVDDWIPETQLAPRFCSDIFFLTRRVGTRPVFYGEYQDFSRTLSKVTPIATSARAAVTDAGRFLNIWESQAECYSAKILGKPRLVLHAPWLQGRITNVCAPFVLAPINADPSSQYFFAKGSDGLLHDSAVYYPDVSFGDYGVCV